MNLAIIIPARMRSTRLPGKPLIDIAGKSMIRRTYERCAEAFPADAIYLATEDEEIRAHCEAANMNVVMTSADCLTGTDRVAEAARTLGVDYVVNVQGDEPLCNPAEIKLLIEAAQQYPDRVLNGYCEITEESDYRSSSVPKVVVSPDNELVYMSRSPIPGNKAAKFIKSWRQVCIYGYPIDALNRFSEEGKKTPIEEIEDIEILRFVEYGYRVRMIPMSSDSVAVDHPSDVAKVEAVLRKTATRTMPPTTCRIGRFQPRCNPPSGTPRRSPGLDSVHQTV